MHCCWILIRFVFLAGWFESIYRHKVLVVYHGTFLHFIISTFYFFLVWAFKLLFVFIEHSFYIVHVWYLSLIYFFAQSFQSVNLTFCFGDGGNHGCDFFLALLRSNRCIENIFVFGKSYAAFIDNFWNDRIYFFCLNQHYV